MSVFRGTCLGPILFLCFLDDLLNATELLAILFADNTTGLDSHSDLPTLLAQIQSELTKLLHWFTSNEMSLNVSKTKYIIFHTQGKRVDPELTLD